MEIKHPQQPPFNSHDMREGENRWFISRWKVVKMLCMGDAFDLLCSQSETKIHREGIKVAYGNLFTTSGKATTNRRKNCRVPFIQFHCRVDSLSIFHCTHNFYFCFCCCRCLLSSEEYKNAVRCSLRGVEEKVTNEFEREFYWFFCDSSQRFLLFYSPLSSCVFRQWHFAQCHLSQNIHIRDTINRETFWYIRCNFDGCKQESVGCVWVIWISLFNFKRFL